MSLLILPDKRIKQPDTVVDIQQQYKNITSAVIPINGFLKEIVAPVGFIKSGTTGKVNIAGTETTTFTSGSHLYRQNPVGRINNDFIIGFQFYIPEYTGTKALYSLGSNATDGNTSFLIQHHYSSLRFYFGGAYRSIDIGSFAENKLQTVIIKCSRIAVGSAQVVKIWTSRGTYATDSSTWIGDSTNEYLGSGFGGSFDGGISLYFTGRAIPDEVCKQLTKNPWQIFEPEQRPFFFASSGSGATTLTQSSRFDNSNNFYSTTVTPGAVNLSPLLFTNINSFYTHALTQGGAPQTLTASLYSNSQSFYAPTLSFGSVTLSQSARFDNSASFYGHTIVAGGSLVQSSIFNNSNAFYSHAVSVGSVALTSPYFVNNNAFYSAAITVGSGITLQPPLLTNTNTFYSHTVSPGSVKLTQSSIFTNSQIFYNHAITGDGILVVMPEIVNFDTMIQREMNFDTGIDRMTSFTTDINRSVSFTIER
jgi:hypothetical protein